MTANSTDPSVLGPFQQMLVAEVAHRLGVSPQRALEHHIQALPFEAECRVRCWEKPSVWSDILRQTDLRVLLVGPR